MGRPRGKQARFGGLVRAIRATPLRPEAGTLGPHVRRERMNG